RRTAPRGGRSFANAETGAWRSAGRSRVTGTRSTTFAAVIATTSTPRKTKTLVRISGRGLVVPPDLGPPLLADPQPPRTRSAPLTVGIRASLPDMARDAVSRD